jgi:UPF0271 protein
MSMKSKIDINCDLGESYGEFTVGNDAKIMSYITSANIACGFHAGDPLTMTHTINLAKKYKVAVGAHPGYPDIMGFGRREMQLTSEEAVNYTIYQVSALHGFAKAANVKLQHVKPHGAFYNTAARDENLSKAIAEAVSALDESLIVFAPPNSILARTAAKKGLRVACEFFADRAYNSDGSLVSRKQPNAVIQDPRKVVERAVRVAKDATVLTVDGEVASFGEVHTICVHGDTPAAVRLAQALKRGLTRKGIEVTPVGNFL